MSLREIFDSEDTFHTGFIPEEDARRIFRELGLMQPPHPKHQRLLQSLETTSTGRVPYVSFEDVAGQLAVANGKSLDFYCSNYILDNKSVYESEDLNTSVSSLRRQESASDRRRLNASENSMQIAKRMIADLEDECERLRADLEEAIQVKSKREHDYKDLVVKNAKLMERIVDYEAAMTEAETNPYHLNEEDRKRLRAVKSPFEYSSASSPSSTKKHHTPTKAYSMPDRDIDVNTQSKTTADESRIVDLELKLTFANQQISELESQLEKQTTDHAEKLKVLENQLVEQVNVAKREFSKFNDKDIAQRKQILELVDAKIAAEQEITKLKEDNSRLELSFQDPQVFQQLFYSKGIDLSVNNRIPDIPVESMDAQIFEAAPVEQRYQEWKLVAEENRELRLYIDRMLSLVMISAPHLLERK